MTREAPDQQDTAPPVPESACFAFGNTTSEQE